MKRTKGMAPDLLPRVAILILLLSCLELKAANEPALIPMPRSLQWKSGHFALGSHTTIYIGDPSLQKEAGLLRSLVNKNMSVVVGSPENNTRAIFLKIGEVDAPIMRNEAYRLTVNTNLVELVANTSAGIFYSIQTLLQLMSNNQSLKACEIVDYPAYNWRGYMIDVGRNYQSMELLKQQIDIMAKYKLNIFHFHLTEDIAWRWQIKKYPQLTSADVTIRDKGQFYSVEEMKELIDYCRQRYITLVPEIDMPGHSKAFTRAMGTDMQTDTGLGIVQNIIDEVCSSYDFPFLHIGADEVEVRNKNFLPSAISRIRHHNKQAIGWAPGGNYDDETVRQLWKDEGELDIRKKGVKYIDSRFLYISDMEPESAVVSVFNRQLGEKLRGDEDLLGAEFCLWDDRRMANEKDRLIMNPVYPVMLAFGERSWRGGGYPGINFHIGPDTSARAKDFADFEKRLIKHKEKYFTQLPFTYVKQAHIRWKLFGPFENNGDLKMKFWPEERSISLADSAADGIAVGGAIWLWHTHWPITSAWLPKPAVKTTWYAFTRFWSASDTVLNLWVESKNLSRSGADATPSAGQWDYNHTQFWLNDSLLKAPEWKNPGLEAGQLEVPLTNEGYYYRPPVKTSVKKGWNRFLIKLPVEVFDPLKDWQQPPKLMFTVLPVKKGKGVNWVEHETKFQPDSK